MLDIKELKENEVEILIALNSFHEARDSLVYKQKGWDINLPEHLAKKVKKGSFKLISVPQFEQGFITRGEVSDLIRKITGKKNFEKNFSNCIKRLKGVIEEKDLIWRRSISKNIEENRIPCSMLRIKPTLKNIDFLTDVTAIFTIQHKDEITKENSDYYWLNPRIVVLSRKEYPEEFKKTAEREERERHIAYASLDPRVNLAEIGKKLLEKDTKNLIKKLDKRLSRSLKHEGGSSKN